jgi:hypothetical protein
VEFFIRWQRHADCSLVDEKITGFIRFKTDFIDHVADNGNHLFFARDPLDGCSDHEGGRVVGDLNLGLLIRQHHVGGFLNAQILDTIAVAHGKQDHGDKKNQDREVDDIHSAFDGQPIQHDGASCKMMRNMPRCSIKIVRLLLALSFKPLGLGNLFLEK